MNDQQICRCWTFAGKASGTQATSTDADWYPLDRFKAALPQLESNATVAVHCKSGYRSMIACSLLQRAGHNVINVIGGFDAWEKAQLPTTAGAAVGA